jgi:hypothetical protein
MSKSEHLKKLKVLGVLISQEIIMSTERVEEFLEKILGGNVPEPLHSSDLVEVVFRFPAYFGYTALDEDSRSDFLLHLHQWMPKLISSYDSSRSSFKTYLSTMVRLSARGWIRRVAKRRVAEETLAYCYYEEHGEMLLSAEPGAEYAFHQEYPLPAKPRIADPKLRELLLFLTLKCAFDLTDWHIDRVAQMIGMAPEKLLHHVESVKNLMYNRAEAKKEHEEKHNRTFFLTTRYGKELEKLDTDTCQYGSIQQKHAFQRNLLNLKNHAWRKQFKITPTNTSIAAVLGVKPRKVHRILFNATHKQSIPTLRAECQ